MTVTKLSASEFLIGDTGENCIKIRLVKVENSVATIEVSTFSSQERLNKYLLNLLKSPEHEEFKGIKKFKYTLNNIHYTVDNRLLY